MKLQKHSSVSSFAKVLFGTVGVVLLGVILFIIYVAVQRNTELRSQAHEDGTEYKVWDFKNGLQGWYCSILQCTIVNNYLHITKGVAGPIPSGMMVSAPRFGSAVENLSLSLVIPDNGLKRIEISIKVLPKTEAVGIPVILPTVGQSGAQQGKTADTYACSSQTDCPEGYQCGLENICGKGTFCPQWVLQFFRRRTRHCIPQSGKSIVGPVRHPATTIPVTVSYGVQDQKTGTVKEGIIKNITVPVTGKFETVSGNFAELAPFILMGIAIQIQNGTEADISRIRISGQRIVRPPVATHSATWRPDRPMPTPNISQCWSKVILQNGKYYWPDPLRGKTQVATVIVPQVLTPLAGNEEEQYHMWVNRGRPNLSVCGATPTPPTPTYPPLMCTPPACRSGEVFYCSGNCPGGCGTTCVTPTP